MGGMLKSSLSRLGPGNDCKEKYRYYCKLLKSTIKSHVETNKNTYTFKQKFQFSKESILNTHILQWWSFTIIYRIKIASKA